MRKSSPRFKITIKYEDVHIIDIKDTEKAGQVN